MISIISILLELIINKYINQSSLFIPLFSLLSIIFINKNNKIKYYSISIVLGIIYDLIYNNFYVLNGILFFIISIFIHYYLKQSKFNLINIFILSIYIIIIYQLLLFIIYNAFNYINYSIEDFIFIINHYLLLNIIYVTIIYFIYKSYYRIGDYNGKQF